jgi:cyclophilin family peptidyl-prolyl cis-trans isomerase
MTMPYTVPGSLGLRRQGPVRPTTIEALESRRLLTAPTLAPLPTSVTLRAGAPLQIPLDGLDADGDPLVFAHSLSNKTVSTSFTPSTNRSLKISVSHASSGASDPAFTGDLILKLCEDKAPTTTARIIQLAQSGFYNSTTFHRIINSFMIQGGDPLGNGTGGSGKDFDDEFASGYQFTGSGQLAMAKSYDDTNDSQFFITEGPQRHLDFNHTIFGQLVEGEAVREKLSNVPVDANNKPLGATTITSVSVISDSQNGVLTLSVPNNVTSGTVDISVVARDPSGADSAPRTFTVTIAPDTVDNAPILGPIADVVTRANTPVSFQLTSTDVEGTAPAYLNWVGLYNNFAGSQAVRLLPPDNLPPESPVRDIDVAVDFNTGATTVTPKNNVAGVFPLYLGVAQDPNAFDSQVVPLFVSPAAPTSIDLLSAYDTGTSATDNITRLNNATAGSKLQFLVGGVLPGALVKLFDGTTLLGQATVAAGQTSVTITTSGAATLSNGTHNLTATQTLANLAWSVGNRSGTTNLDSLASAAQPITVDATPPTINASVPFNPAIAPHSLTLGFSEDVSTSLVPGDLKLQNLTTNTTVATSAATFLFGSGHYRFTFDTPGGILPDGNYRATINAADVTDKAGNPLAAGITVDFFVLAGDANRDRNVNFADLLALAKNYGQTGKTWADGDFNLNGTVNFADLLTLAKSYNKTLAAPPPAPAPAPVFAAASTAALAPHKRSATNLFSQQPVARPTPQKSKPVIKAARRA